MYSNQSPTKVNIEEANKHLQMLHGRVEELEKSLQAQSVEFQKRTEGVEAHFHMLLTQKDADIFNLRRALEASENHRKDMEIQLQHKDRLLFVLQQKCRKLDEMTKYTPTLEKLVSLLKHVQSGQTQSVDNHVPMINQTQNHIRPQPQPQVGLDVARKFHRNEATRTTSNQLPNDHEGEVQTNWRRPRVDLSPTRPMSRSSHASPSRHFPTSKDETKGNKDHQNEQFVPHKPERELYL